MYVDTYICIILPYIRMYVCILSGIDVVDCDLWTLAPVKLLRACIVTYVGGVLCFQPFPQLKSICFSTYMLRAHVCMHTCLYYCDTCIYAHTYERAYLRAKNAVYMWPPIAKIMLIYYNYYVRSLDCMVCTYIRTYVYVTVMNSRFGQVTCTVWEIVKSREAFFLKKSPSLPLTSLDSLSVCDPLRIHTYMHASNNTKNLLNLAHIYSVDSSAMWYIIWAGRRFLCY